MPNKYEDFAPVWLARTIFEDAAYSELVEKFLRQIPTHVCGGIYVVNTTTDSKYEASDRYMSTIVFLASIWMRGQINFKVTARVANTEVELDTSLLLPTVPPPIFLEAMKMGEKVWERKEKERRVMSMCSSPPVYEEE